MKERLVIIRKGADQENNFAVAVAVSLGRNKSSSPPGPGLGIFDGRMRNRSGDPREGDGLAGFLRMRAGCRTLLSGSGSICSGYSRLVRMILTGPNSPDATSFESAL